MSASLRLRLENVRCNFPCLYVPNSFQGKERYSVQLLLPADSPALKALTNGINAAAKARWGNNYKRKLDSFKGSRQQWPIRERDDGSFTITVKRNADKGAPLVIDQQKRDLPAEAGKIYSGVWLNVSLDVFCYDKGGNAGVTTYLNGVQLVKEDASLSGGGTAESCRADFDDLGATGSGSQAAGASYDDEEVPFDWSA